MKHKSIYKLMKGDKEGYEQNMRPGMMTHEIYSIVRFLSNCGYSTGSRFLFVYFLYFTCV